MSTVMQLLKALLHRNGQRDVSDEAYLANAVDIHELERRMRAIEERGRSPLSDMHFEFYPR
jgi:hypothetical protein